MADLEALKTDRREIEKLTKTRGWAALNEIMNREILAAAMGIANKADMSLDAINFQRGAIWAAHQLLELPERLMQRLDGEILMESAKTPPKKDDHVPPPL